MKNKVDDIPPNSLIASYNELKSSYKVAKKYQVSPTAVKRVLKNLKVLKTQKEAARIRNLENTEFRKHITAKMSSESRKKISNSKKGSIPWNKGKTGIYNKDQIKRLSELCKERIGMKNPNYKNGTTIKRERDKEYHVLKKIKGTLINQGKGCSECGTDKNLIIHHKIPCWVKIEAKSDPLNLMLFCKECHLKIAHKGNWATFNTSLISKELMLKYDLDAERLNDLARLK